MSSKLCGWCGDEKPLTEFYANPAGRDGLRPECKACTRAYRSRWYAENAAEEVARVKRWQQANTERVNASQRERRKNPARRRKERDGHLRRKYGITLEDYDAKLAEQGGVCGICGREPNPNISLHVDHDHQTGALRGLLCFPCNQAIGSLREDPALLEVAAAYLRSHDPEVARLTALACARVAALPRPAWE